MHQFRTKILINKSSSEDGTPIIKRQQFQLPEELNDGEVILKLDGATICNSDVHTMTGRRKVIIIRPRTRITMLISGANPRSAGARGLRGGGEERQGRDQPRREAHLLRDRRVRQVRVQQVNHISTL